ncbi:MAG: CopG family transcriptional regulator [Gammaproteobacteria bacterium]|nr:CopG family transcriptional regulator [Gammaproteobacteria bacterium]
MRTTIRLDEELLKEAKRQATESGVTLQAIIEESLRERLARGRDRQQARRPVRLKTAGSGGSLPGIDLDDSASLLDAMEGGD